MIEYLIMGTLLGLSAGFAPGPLASLVISETLRYDIKAGIRVAVVPIITDIPIIAISLFLLTALSGYERLLGIISIAGGAFVLYLGIQSLRTRGFHYKQGQVKSKSLAKGIITNFLSPHPYLFWLAVGAPAVTKAWAMNVQASLAFIGGFYVCLVGVKVLLALAASKSKAYLKGPIYRYTLMLLGVLLCVLAIVLFKDGLGLLGIW